MLADKKYLQWCARQNKGIKIATQSKNLQNAYLKKSQTALQSMQVNAREGIDEWAISASYYAKYFAIYALFSQLGIKCEIHDCTIALFGYLFGNDISQPLLEDLRQAKEDRIDVQYYNAEISIDLQEMISKTKEFVIVVEEIIDGLNQQRIDELRQKTKEALK
ncbi:HEPN domain-containing protein [Marine Group I thaumarchaeote SCGC AAA799-E16]|uniref:HEPN domain-containing protein n=4 Tax=Marine Group I TaxID=905826 RepID=A0A081RLA5_9ARCH|nr:HEPN domain-containing protein [Marine Group I thaumarchaeote SCGC AAA799-N04]KER05556.1 HEPN domain-containing protein [Marine Group I thaumarchaeote SCGC AAA799-E16]KFM15609.1 HEPN domain-containing protein [Marine Group I thaumarchaeote SCGC AAA799-D11]KFM15772.1 HEPN domain-containing protein [Marine Group I thaumarchaeote SCGC RSA3]